MLSNLFFPYQVSCSMTMGHHRKKNTADLAGQQRMPTIPWHMILPLISACSVLALLLFGICLFCVIVLDLQSINMKINIRHILKHNTSIFFKFTSIWQIIKTGNLPCFFFFLHMEDFAIHFILCQYYVVIRTGKLTVY